MNNKPYKKPPLQEFAEVLQSCGGNLTNVSKALGVNRTTIWQWAKDDTEFAEAITASRKKMLDECLAAARIVAVGIPITNNGKFEGWQERPDPSMLRYLISTLGRDEGFGENLDITSGGKSVAPIQIEVITSRDQVRREDNE